MVTYEEVQTILIKIRDRLTKLETNQETLAAAILYHERGAQSGLYEELQEIAGEKSHKKIAGIDMESD